MGNSDTKLNFRKAVVQLTTKTQVRRQYMKLGNNIYVVLHVFFPAILCHIIKINNDILLPNFKFVMILLELLKYFPTTDPRPSLQVTH